MGLAEQYPFLVEETKNGMIIRLKELLSAVVGDVRGREAVGMIGARFHQTVAEIAIEVCARAREFTGLNEVALSGGVWQNRIVLDLVRDGLKRDGFVVYSHEQVPSNDGGLSLGQAVIANYAVAKPCPSVAAISA
jgi:hydrogenase maturation protein HypF